MAVAKGRLAGQSIPRTFCNFVSYKDSMGAAISYPPTAPRRVTGAPKQVRNSYSTAPGKRQKVATALTPDDLAELRYLWHEYESALGAKSVHGAIQDRLRRNSPKSLAGPIVDLLRVAGGRTPLKQMVKALRLEHDATRYEVTGAVGGMVSRGRVSVEGGGPKAIDWIQGDLDEKREGIDDVYVRLLPAVANIRYTREARWREQDEEIERGWRTISCGEDAAPVPEPIDRRNASVKAEAVLAALATIGKQHARVLYRAYGPRPPNVYYDIFGSELAPLVESTPTVRRVREERVSKELEKHPRKRRWIEAQVTPASVVRQGLDGDKVKRDAFVRAVTREAEAVLLEATRAYRAARAK